MGNNKNWENLFAKYIIDQEFIIHREPLQINKRKQKPNKNAKGYIQAIHKRGNTEHMKIYTALNNRHSDK